MDVQALILMCNKEWQACLRHSALTKLQSKTLTKASLERYFYINACYLQDLKVVYEKALSKASTSDEKMYCKKMLEGMHIQDFSKMNQMSKQYAKQISKDVLDAYASFYARCLMEENIYLIAASLPCTLTYAQIAQSFSSIGGWLEAFMQEFLAPAYQALCTQTITLLNDFLQQATPFQQLQITKIIKEGCHHEQAFWNIANEILEEEKQMNEMIMKKVEETCPLVHCITNYVTVNDCANMILAAKGSPIMADEIEEVEDITSICNALVINIGTLNERTIASMIKAGKKANALGHPVILDPVGAGASPLRTQTVFTLLKEVKFSIIRGNISEIKTVYEGSGSTQGVDANVEDVVSDTNLDTTANFAKALAKRTGAIIVITGALDILANENDAYVVRNGHCKMSKITGTGCQLTTLLAVYATANKENMFSACIMAVTMMGIAGEIGVERMERQKTGTNSLRTYIIDAISMMDYQTWKERANYARI